MECLHGCSLAEYLEKNGRLSIALAADIFEQVSIALAASHSKGVVHRDLKPANIFLVDEPRKPMPVKQAQPGQAEPAMLAKVVDFGIATLTGQGSEVQKLTSPGCIFGSPLYMSPEQTMGRATTGATDVYSCGCALFEVLTGELPFRGESAFATMMMHQSEPVPDLGDYISRPPQRLRGLLASMMAKDPDLRPDFGSISADLRSIKLSVIGAAYPDNSVDVRTERPMDAPEAVIKKTFPAALFVSLSLIIVAGAVMSLYFGKNSSFPKLAVPDLAAQQTDVDADNAKSKADKKPEAAVRTAATGEGQSLLQLPSRYLVSADKGHVVYQFPVNISLGLIHWFAQGQGLSEEKKNETFEAKGRLIGPENSYNIGLVAGEAMFNNPGLFRPFGPSDLAELTMDQPYGWTNEHVAAASAISHLTELHVCRSHKITDGCVPYLDKLTDLKCLTLSSTDISAAGLSKLKRLPQLVLLDVQGMKNISLIIQKLPPQGKLTHAIFSHTEIGDADIQHLCGLKNLDFLTIDDCPRLTDRSLLLMAEKKNWSSLRVRSCNFSGRAMLAFLRGCPALNDLTLARHQFQPRDLFEIKKECDRKGISLHLKEDEYKKNGEDVYGMGELFSGLK